MPHNSNNLKGDGFAIDNCIIKGDPEYYDVKENNLGELIFNALNESPEYIGQIVALTNQKITFADIKSQSIRLAIWLSKQGIKPGDVVSFCSPRHPDAETIFCGISFVGAIYAPFMHNVDLATARHTVSILHPKIIFANKTMIETLREAAFLENHALKIVVFDSDNDTEYISFNDVLNIPSTEEIERFQVIKVDTEDTCAIFHTSGTTGVPKFMAFSNKIFIHQALQFDINRNSESRNRIILTYFCPGWLVQTLFSIRSIFIRQTLVFHGEFEPRETCKIIEKYKINTLAWDVYMIALLVESNVINRYDLTSVTRIHSIGSKLFPEVRGKMLQIFPNVHGIGRGLGILETGLLTFFTESCCNPKSEGTVVPNVQLKIIDVSTSTPLGHNKPGELCVKSPWMISGYYKNTQLTKSTFDSDGWFHTGDEAYYDENGEVIVVGRLKEIIKYREAELQPLCIEQILLSHPNIVDAAIVGIFHDVNIEQPVAFVKVVQGSTVTEEDVLKLTSDLEYSDTFKDSVIFIDEIPRNTNGKINRRILRERAEKFYNRSKKI